MNDTWQPFLSLLLVLAILSGPGQYTCLSCPEQISAPAACHDQGDDRTVDALTKMCCCAAIDCAPQNQYQTPAFRPATDPSSQYMQGPPLRLVVAALPFSNTLLALPVYVGPIAKGPLYLLHSSRLI
ncbi:MAG: hypothetical protein GKR89_11625 [Candidatus Latescibacteria bacterium]|nr:hypothetical protein [Candidatus Latescibacterota bacterium]